MMERIERRRFLRDSANGVAMFAGAGATLTARKAVRAAPANDRTLFGLIGVGGRGKGLAGLFAVRPDAECVYLCDPDTRRAKGAVKRFTPEGGRAPKAVADFRRILDDKNLDAVIVATPDHWHALATVLACQVGKDVYVEKPASYSIREGRQMVKAARRYKRVVQVGTQNRSAEYIHKAIEYIRSGKLGRIPLAAQYEGIRQVRKMEADWD